MLKVGFPSFTIDQAPHRRVRFWGVGEGVWMTAKGAKQTPGTTGRRADRLKLTHGRPQIPGNPCPAECQIHNIDDHDEIAQTTLIARPLPTGHPKP
jgi:hypothetical protein